MKKVAVMISWWLDSYIMYYYAKKNWFQPVPIRVNLWQPYREKELEAIKNFEFYDEIIQVNFADYTKKMVGDIIPWRNLLLWVIWANYADEVWIGALYGERTGKNMDKSYQFFEEASKVLTYNFQMLREYTFIKTPFFHLTKANLVKRALENWLTKEQLFKTSTCYDEKKHNCWKCPTCFKRYVAMKLNGIDEEFESNPLESDYAKKMKQETINKDPHLAPERREEYMKIFNITEKEDENIS